MINIFNRYITIKNKWNGFDEFIIIDKFTLSSIRIGTYNDKVSYINSLFVVEKYRHKGTGTKLVKKAENICLKLKCNKIIVLIDVENITSFKLFNKLNYNIKSRFFNQYTFEKYINNENKNI